MEVFHTHTRAHTHAHAHAHARTHTAPIIYQQKTIVTHWSPTGKPQIYEEDETLWSDVVFPAFLASCLSNGGYNSSSFPLACTGLAQVGSCLLYTSPSPRDRQKSRMPSSA